MSIFKKKSQDPGEGDLAVNRISKKTNFILNIIFLIWSLVCILPLLLVVIVSFSSEQSIFENGYTFSPRNGAWMPTISSLGLATS